jgi:competence protein ComEC
LRFVQLQYVIVCAGEGNNYGHPRQEVLERATDLGAAVLRTDELGTIELIADGEALWWEARG